MRPTEKKQTSIAAGAISLSGATPRRERDSDFTAEVVVGVESRVMLLEIALRLA